MCDHHSTPGEFDDHKLPVTSMAEKRGSTFTDHQIDCALEAMVESEVTGVDVQAAYDEVYHGLPKSMLLAMGMAGMPGGITTKFRQMGDSTAQRALQEAKARRADHDARLKAIRDEQQRKARAAVAARKIEQRRRTKVKAARAANNRRTRGGK